MKPKKPKEPKETIETYLTDVIVALVSFGEITAHEAVLGIAHNTRDVAECYAEGMSAYDCARTLCTAPVYINEEPH